MRTKNGKPIQRRVKMENEIDFKQRLRNLLEQKGVSIAKIARVVDVHQDTIYNYLADKTDMSAGTLEKITRALHKMEDDKPTKP